MEETLTYWQYFTIFHENVRTVSWPILLYVAVGIFVFSILRVVFFYAVAKKMEDWIHSSLLIWCIAALYYKFAADEKEILEDEQGKSGRPTLKGGNAIGGWIDVLAWLILGTILIWLWPIVFTIVILFGPIQLSRNHFMRKKLFIARLKGEELDI